MAAERIVIVGAGQAGAELAAALRAGGFAGGLTLVGEEPAPPYQRPPLSKGYLLGEMDRERLALRPESWWREQEVTLRLGARVRRIDREGAALELQDGARLPWDRLALTTGSRPRRLPAEAGGALAGAHAVRILLDVDRMAPEFRPGRRLVVVGGGYIGLEAAAVAARRGLSVRVIEAAPRLLARVASEPIAAHFRELHRAHGVEVLEGAALERLEGGDRVEAARLRDGRVLPCDFALVGIGAIPNDDLAASAGLAAQDGILVDEHGATSDPRIVAAGDCAAFPWRGRRVRLESVQNAVDQARAAAAALLGRPAPYAPVPWFWSDQYDAKLQIAGLREGADREVIRPGLRAGGLSVWSFAGSDFLAVETVNDPRAYMTGRRWLEAGRAPDPERLADARTALADCA